MRRLHYGLRRSKEFPEQRSITARQGASLITLLPVCSLFYLAPALTLDRPVWGVNRTISLTWQKAAPAGKRRFSVRLISRNKLCKGWAPVLTQARWWNHIFGSREGVGGKRTGEAWGGIIPSLFGSSKLSTTALITLFHTCFRLKPCSTVCSITVVLSQAETLTHKKLGLTSYTLYSAMHVG